MVKIDILIVFNGHFQFYIQNQLGQPYKVRLHFDDDSVKGSADASVHVHKVNLVHVDSGTRYECIADKDMILSATQNGVMEIPVSDERQPNGTLSGKFHYVHFISKIKNSFEKCFIHHKLFLVLL